MGYDLIVNTDGVCCGNPGEMGIGGIITDTVSKKIIYTVCCSKGIGTNNESEMLAILDTLSAIENFKFVNKNILIQCNSHLVVEQLNNERCLNEDRLMQLRTKIVEYSKVLNCKFYFSWIPQERNKTAWALASRGAKMPIAYFQDGMMVEWNSSLVDYISREELEKLPMVNESTTLQIQHLNNLKKPCTSSIFSLMSFGIDKYSRAKTNELLDFIEIRFGYYTREYMIKTLEDLNCRYGKNVLRWVARGLKPNLAFIKAALEIEIKENNLKE